MLGVVTRLCDLVTEEWGFDSWREKMFFSSPLPRTRLWLTFGGMFPLGVKPAFM